MTLGDMDNCLLFKLLFFCLSCLIKTEVKCYFSATILQISTIVIMAFSIA